MYEKEEARKRFYLHKNRLELNLEHIKIMVDKYPNELKRDIDFIDVGYMARINRDLRRIVEYMEG